MNCHSGKTAALLEADEILNQEPTCEKAMLCGQRLLAEQLTQRVVEGGEDFDTCHYDYVEAWLKMKKLFEVRFGKREVERLVRRHSVLDVQHQPAVLRQQMPDLKHIMDDVINDILFTEH
ncbi:MAG: hypothetical protein GY807_24190 [Gammaproteobacteria bacterium]|nr:hypothetical protein [Gammaproteobacteria bacterium]